MAVQQWQQTGMVNMGMGNQYIVNFGRIDRNLLIFIQIRSLLHSAVHQQMDVSHLHIMTASCHLMGCPQKFKFQITISFVKFLIYTTGALPASGPLRFIIRALPASGPLLMINFTTFIRILRFLFSDVS